ncbi:FkbM family methyltransferase [Flavobacterium agricola]|uniref:FkbM family methyltransferase n=1 Tax=Flavobacterium agricola TaxID=2870839 RepID=A0ABY6M3S8_9FLAO|nr:FkbM family methyltransferase [Flavobacterium agricola]UYW02098.1 FkbM family methyltransferase [Flavobacterium agricola]
MKKPILYIYKKLPFKKSICFLLNFLFNFNKRIYRNLYFEGVFKVQVEPNKSFLLRNFNDSYIEKCIFWTGIYGEWEKNSLKIWSEFARSSNYIIDIGANTGVYSLLAKCINEKANVYAFEPVDRINLKLSDNIKRNNYNIVASNNAISNKNGIATFYDFDSIHSTTASLIQPKKAKSNHKIIESAVPTIRLDTFVKNNNIPKVDLIKIDVETFEVQVFEGAMETIEQNMPTILVEILNEEIAKGIEALVNKLGYVFYNIDEKNGVSKVTTLSKSSSYNFLLCTVENSKIVEKIFSAT